MTTPAITNFHARDTVSPGWLQNVSGMSPERKGGVKSCTPARSSASANLRRRSPALRGSSLSLPELIAQGESDKLEFKSSLRWGIPDGGVVKGLEKVVLKTLAGFLNGKGGTLLIGVADDGTVLGLDGDYGSSDKIADRDGFELHLRGLISAVMGEAVHSFITVTFHAIDDNDVCQVVIEPADHPVYLQDDGKAVFFLRTGNATNALPVDEVVKYYSKRWG